MNQEYAEKMRREDSVILTELEVDRKRFYGAVTPPVFMNSLHTFDTYEDFLAFDRKNDDEFIYGRASNPTVRVLENKLAKLERGNTALAFASGMAASVAAISACTVSGCHIIAMKNIYRPLRTYIDSYCVGRYNMTVTYIDGETLEDYVRARKPETALIIMESPSSVILSVVPIKEVADYALAQGIKTFIDNTYCTPLFQKPLELGVDIVMHTASKYLSGHSDVIAGFLVSKDKELMENIAQKGREVTGGMLGPAEAWLILRGMRTLLPRMDRHQANALAICNYLKNTGVVRKLYYTGLPEHPQAAIISSQQTGSSGLLSFEPDFSVESAIHFVNHLKLFHIGVSWGGFESLVMLPHYKDSDEVATYFGASRNTIRMHIGLEEAQCLIEDIEQAFSTTKANRL